MQPAPTKDPISELRALISQQDHRLTFLENELRRQNDLFSDRLNRQRQELASEIERLKADNYLHPPEKPELALQLKRDLISQMVLPELLFVPTAAQFEGIIAHFTRESGGNVAVFIMTVTNQNMSLMLRMLNTSLSQMMKRING
jgi:hypothetical protein